MPYQRNNEVMKKVTVLFDFKPPYFITGDIKLKVQGDVSASVDLKGSHIEYDRTLPFRDLKFTEDDPTSLEGMSTLTLCLPPLPPPLPNTDN